MKRDCFFCNVDVRSFSRDLLSLPGVGDVEIGFAICPNCGMVIQSPAVNPSELCKYYEQTAVYDNSARDGRPDDDKTQGVNRQIRLIQEVAGSISESVFQLGCSDGYTLSRMREAGAVLTDGIDPSVAANELANSRYRIKTTLGVFEEFIPKRKYGLVVMTHVLEHLYNPVEALEKVSSMQDGGGWLFIEVPLLEKVEKLPPGYFAFEHLNYFSELTLLKLLYCAGYVLCYTEKFFDLYDYPVISVIAKKGTVSSDKPDSDYDRAERLVKDYLGVERAAMEKIEARVKQRLEKGREVYIWGAGVHTAQLFAGTDLKDYLNVKGLLDSSPVKWGTRMGNLECFKADDLTLGEGDTIVISSYCSEQEIYDALAALRERGVAVVRLYGGDD